MTIVPKKSAKATKPHVGKKSAVKSAQQLVLVRANKEALPLTMPSAAPQDYPGVQMVLRRVKNGEPLCWPCMMCGERQNYGDNVAAVYVRDYDVSEGDFKSDYSGPFAIPCINRLMIDLKIAYRAAV